MKKLILASASPVRKQLLKTTGVSFSVDISNYYEDMDLNLEPRELAKYLSAGKARAVASRHKNAVILAADSFGIIDGKLLGKPHSRRAAQEMLRLLSGKPHIFITGFTILDTDSNKEYSDTTEAKVYFRHLGAEEINNYIDRENVLDKAGAYYLQGLGVALVDKLEGDYGSVVGLPLSKIVPKLREFGVKVL